MYTGVCSGLFDYVFFPYSFSSQFFVLGQRRIPFDTMHNQHKQPEGWDHMLAQFILLELHAKDSENLNSRQHCEPAFSFTGSSQ